MKDLCKTNVILGMQIVRSPTTLLLTQSSYIEKVLKKFGYFDYKSMSTLFDPSKHLVCNLGDTVDQLTYSQIISSLMYAMHCTGPDIAFVVSILSKFTSNPSIDHWTTLVRVLKYLKSTLNFGLLYTTFSAVV